MKKKLVDQLLSQAVDSVIEISSTFLEQVPDNQIPLVFSFEFESGILSFDFLLVHSQGCVLLCRTASEAFFEEPLRHAIIMAGTTFDRSEFVFRVEVYGFQIYSEYDSTSALDQEGKPVMSSEIVLRT